MKVYKGEIDLCTKNEIRFVKLLSSHVCFPQGISQKIYIFIQKHPAAVLPLNHPTQPTVQIKLSDEILRKWRKTCLDVAFFVRGGLKQSLFLHKHIAYYLHHLLFISR